jgi:hypothetical protein
MTAVLILFGNSAASIPESDKRYVVNAHRDLRRYRRVDPPVDALGE